MPPFPGIIRMFSPVLVSSSTASGLAVTAAAIVVILLASTVTIINAQQLEQLTSEPSAIQIRTIAENTKDSFRVQVPQGWVIHDVNNTGFALMAEVLDGVGILAQLCPEKEQQLAVLPNAGGNASVSNNNNNNNSSCQGAQEEVIHIVRYPNLSPRLGFASDDVISNDDVTPDIILGYQMQKLQEVGYRDIRVVDSTDTTINVDISTGLNNSTIAATVPAKLVEMTYSTNLAPDQIRKGYFISTATNTTPRNLGNMTGYGIFYEGTSSAVAEGGEETRLPSGGGLILPIPVMEVFDSFELIATEEEAQATEEELTDSLTSEINSNDTEGVAPATFEFEADIAGGTEPYTVNWDLDDDGIVESNEETVVATFNEAGTYNVTLTITDSEDQTASDSIEITVEEGEGGEGEEEAVVVEEGEGGEGEEEAVVVEEGEGGEGEVG
jgi:PKD repeat protein